MSTINSVADIPPSFSAANQIDLVSVKDSRITHVSLYTGRAEITRLFKLVVKTGQNQVNVIGLPDVLDQSSLRVEGRGAATIHDVTVSRTPTQAAVTTSPALDELLFKEAMLKATLARTQGTLTKSLEGYMESLNVKEVDVGALDDVTDKYDAVMAKLDEKGYKLEKELVAVGKDIQDERLRLAGPTRAVQQLGMQIGVSLFAENEGEVEIVLIYAVTSATWDVNYDIRVNMQTKENPIVLLYKASIVQHTGESWDDVPLTLETASPTYGLDIPILTRWSMSVRNPTPSSRARSPPVRYRRAERRSRSRSPSPRYRRRSRSPPGVMMPAMPIQQVNVVSKGNINATFSVPGLVNVPSDFQKHNITIAQLTLGADLSWVSVPKRDTKVHLKAKIANSSDYTFINGDASVYVDGSFIGKASVPSVSPQETFDCSLGIDPSIRVTYLPLSKKVSQSGLLQKTTTSVYDQRISIFNSKSISVDKLTIIDQVPVMEDAQINLKLLSPTLSTPPANTSSKANKKDKFTATTTVSKGITVQWEGYGQAGVEESDLGKDGHLNWLCSVPPQGKVNLSLQWEVSFPSGTNILERSP